MRLRLTARAFADLEELSSYIRAHDPSAAERVSAAILESLKMLTVFPMLGRRQSVAGVRKLVTRRYRYLAYYRVDETSNEVIVLTIQHPSRDRKFDDT
jgi:plasmid stabilization system protein ParE